MLVQISLLFFIILIISSKGQPKGLALRLRIYCVRIQKGQNPGGQYPLQNSGFIGRRDHFLRSNALIQGSPWARPSRNVPFSLISGIKGTSSTYSPSLPLRTMVPVTR